MVREGDKIKLATGEIALVSEVLEAGVAYIAEIFSSGGSVSAGQIHHRDISSVFVEIERPVAQVA